MTAIITAVAILALTWAVEKWRSHPQWSHGEWPHVPLWFVPVTALMAIVLVWSGLIVGEKIGQAAVILERVECQQLQTLYALQSLDSAVVDFAGLKGP